MIQEQLYQWTFQVLDYKNFEGTNIVVYAPTYKDALRKIRDLKLPQLLTFDEIEDGVKLIQVYEMDFISELEQEEVSEPEEE
jgi:hypothetical protein